MSRRLIDILPKIPQYEDIPSEKWVCLNVPVVRDIDSTVLLGPGLQMIMNLTCISIIRQRNAPTGKRLKNSLVKIYYETD